MSKRTTGYCPAKGTAIACTTESGEEPRWHLHAGGVTPHRNVVLRAKACRLARFSASE